MFWTVLLALLLAETSLISALVKKQSGPCPTVNGKKDLDKKLFSGVWYELGYHSRDLPYSGDCLAYNFTVFKEKSSPYQIDIIKNGRVKGKMEMVPKASSSSSYDVELAYPGAGKAKKYNYYVMATDHDCMAVVYTCRNEGKSHISSAYLLSKQRDGLCRLLKQTGGVTDEELKKFPDLEFDEYDGNKQIGCKTALTLRIQEEENEASSEEDKKHSTAEEEEED